MAGSMPMDRDTFLSHLRTSGLVGDADLATVRLPRSARGPALARALVEQGLLTRFQAERLLAGRTSGFILGQYRILSQIGKGGMGRVYKAVHQTMNRVVALKVLAPNLVDTERAQALFLREMQAVARLAHPNLVTAYDANEVGNRYYLVMEYVDGPNLDQLVREHGPLPVEQACEFVRQAAVGLQYAFEMGMVHRDIKPSNLLVVLPGATGPKRRPAVKILDFGLARLHGQAEAPAVASSGTIVAKADTMMGTPDFVSPEQARDVHAADIRSDLYSLGCTLYFLLTGRLPFPGGTALEKLLRHTTEEPTSVEQLRPDVPAELAGVVRRLMAKDPARRYQTPAELAGVLQRFAGGDATAWVAAGTPSAADDPAATPAPLPDSQLEFRTAGTGDELAGLLSTLPPEVGATALCLPHVPLAVAGRVRDHERRRLKIAVGVAVGVVAALLGAVALFCLL